VGPFERSELTYACAAALRDGYSDLAEALLCFSLLEYTAMRRPQNWHAVIELGARLRQIDSNSMLSRVATVCAKILASRSDDLALRRIRNLGSRSEEIKEADVIFLRDVSSDADSPEKVGEVLREELTPDLWYVLPAQARQLLQEADFKWRYQGRGLAADKSLQDWAGEATQYFRVMELLWKPRLRKLVQDDVAGTGFTTPNFGAYVRLFEAALGDDRVTSHLRRVKVQPLELTVVNSLQELRRIRNDASHGGPFPRQLLDKVRRKLLGEGILRAALAAMQQ
jgi:hypothetical protein